MSYVVMQFAPAALEREQAAAYAGLSLTTFEKEVRERRAPQPRQVAGRRVAWLRAELMPGYSAAQSVSNCRLRTQGEEAQGQ